MAAQLPFFNTGSVRAGAAGGGSVNLSAPAGRAATSASATKLLGGGYPGANGAAAPSPGSSAFQATPSLNYAAGAPAPQQPTTAPGNNYTNPGLAEQAFNYSQNQLLNDPWADAFQDQYQQSQNPSAGEQFMNQNLGSLSGPGQGEQYWNATSGQYQNPFAGEQFTREATQNFSPTGAAGAFNNQAQQQYGQFTNYQGAGNSQGQYGQSQGELGGGTQAEGNMSQIAGGYSQYGGGNNALGQYQQNASSGPLAAQQFYNQVGGSYDSTGRYTDPNLAAGQYSQTQDAFGDMPIAQFDPFYDRASQLATQDYNRQAAGRGVYGSSEALSGVGNVITDIEAQRANRSFDAEMQRAQEQRARQQLLGEQARMGDLSGQGAFQANLAGVETFGNLANQAGNQTLAQQTMLGNQARQSDQTGVDAFNANTGAATAYGNINNQMGQLQLDRNRLLGDLASNADTSSQNAQNSNIAGMSALGAVANNADRAETDRYEASTSASNAADRTQLDRQNAGADVAFRTDDTNRANYTAEANVANQAGQLADQRTRTGADIAATGSNNDLNRINAFNDQAQGAESSRQQRRAQADALITGASKQMQDALTQAAASFDEEVDGAADDSVIARLAPKLEAAGWSKEQLEMLNQIGPEAIKAIVMKGKK